jgi:hypothetical protein
VKKEEGSWVALTEDGKGRLIASDQYGKLYRVTPAPLTSGESKVEPLTISLWAELMACFGMKGCYTSS